MLSKPDANKLAEELAKEAMPEWARLSRFVRYARGTGAPPWLPDDAESEYRDIARKARSNWLGLVIRGTAQGLHVDGYGDNTEESTVWSGAWQLNGMDSRQHALHKAVLTCGYGFLIVFPTDDGVPWMRPEAATRMVARFEDPYDEWPVVAYRQISKNHGELYDDEARYILRGKPGRATVTIVPHDLEVCPVVRLDAEGDLLGPPMGQVEPFIATQDRITDATFLLQVVSKYGGFPQRWISGITIGTDAAGDPVPPKIKAYVDRILTAGDPDTKFGQFAAADLKQYVEALEAHIRHLAATSQTPPHYLLGSLVNLSAESLAAAESGLQRKIKDCRELFGERYEQGLRLAALVLGDTDAANDTDSHVHWQDIESRSFSQTADALLKLSQLGVPLEMVLEMIPGWTQQDVDKAVAIVRRGGSMEELAAQLQAAATPPALAIA